MEKDVVPCFIPCNWNLRLNAVLYICLIYSLYSFIEWLDAKGLPSGMSMSFILATHNLRLSVEIVFKKDVSF